MYARRKFCGNLKVCRPSELLRSPARTPSRQPLGAIKTDTNMTQNALTELLGKSILSEDLNFFMKEFDLPINPKKQLDSQGYSYNTKLENKKLGIYLKFDGYKRYRLEYGEPIIIFDDAKDELILNEVTIDNEFVKNKKASVVKLPFGLLLGDDQEIVLQKLGKKPYEKSPNSYGFCWWTQFDEFRILTALSSEFKLIWIRVMKLTLDEKEKIQLKKYLSQQNKNIKPEFVSNILEYCDKLPTTEWRKRKAEGDDIFSDKGINEVEQLLTKYLQTLTEYTEQKKASNIYNSIKKVVSAINKINKQNDSFIDTIEREELCDFINTVIRKTGLVIEDSIDLTEEWREW